MKATLYSPSGEKKGDLELPEVFSQIIREDLAFKLFEAERFNEAQPYAPGKEAGKKHSASGTISHQRHKWASHYGKGVSRIPRKTMWRRGTQFFWIGAEVNMARGGRAGHPPSARRMTLKINKKEQILALNSGIAATANKKIILQRYATLTKVDSIPAVIENLPEKTKSLISTLKKIFGDSFTVALKKKQTRAGRGKSRGRTYKSTAGILIVKGNKEKSSFKGVDVISADELSIQNLYPLGRLTLYTKNALEDLKNA